MFVDKVTVHIKAGNGGNGNVSFRQEKYIDRGGPDGGNGGDGGHIIFLATEDQNTLSRFRFDKRVTAADGIAGSKQNKAGKRGADLVVEVPVGTVVALEDGVILADLVETGQKAIVARGGRGGFGNAHFVSSVRQAPRVAEKGDPGEEFEAVLELKMIADVGLVGLPNAGKSTLLSVISNAKPEIANYPFTTLVPNLGVAVIDADKSLLVADIPGLIEGASEGKGLGDEFLRHIERTKVIAHLIDAYSNGPGEDYQIIRKELEAYSPHLAEVPEIVVLTKTEGMDKEIITMQQEALKKAIPPQSLLLTISAVSHHGVKELLYALHECVQKARLATPTQTAENSAVVIKPNFEEQAWEVIKSDDGRFIVSGRKIERFALRLDLEDEHGERRLRDIMRKMGIMHELKRQKIEEGMTIQIGKVTKGEFEF